MEDGSTMYVHQDAGQGYFGRGRASFHHANVPTGKSECCPYDSRQCSSKPDKDHMVRLTVSYTRVGGTTTGESYPVYCPAGGYVEAHRSSDHFTLRVFDKDAEIDDRVVWIMLAFCLSIKQSQGQPLADAGVYLPDQMFSHDQLYIAVSRVTDYRDLFIMAD
ncbi:hypothetical protein BDC45DRAFT_570040 [Circinella umbellata]|nr:hypothetical protein BDC45DRAFT_570040 [Circinella umbellata]